MDTSQAPRKNLKSDIKGCMEPAKEQAKKALSTLPDDATWEDIMYKLYVMEQIALGTKDLDEGRTVSHEEVKKRFGIE